MSTKLPVAARWVAIMVGASACNEPEISGTLPELLRARQDVDLVFEDPETECAECHPQHVAEWQTSMHAYSATDPVFHGLAEWGQSNTDGQLGDFCVQCHAPVAAALGTAPVYLDARTNRWKQDTRNMGAVAQKGVSCDVCHSITDVIEPVNARGVYTPNGIRRATIEDPVENTKHASTYSPLHHESRVCGMCHAVTNFNGVRLEETFPEWEGSSFNAPGGKTCQDCHMPAYQGQAAKDGPTREVHRHTFVGVDVPLLSDFPGHDEALGLTIELLRSGLKATAQLEPTEKKFKIHLKNEAGHAIPSGATADRQLWVELIVRDGSGQVVFETGTLDSRGDLRDNDPRHTNQPGTDPQLIFYGQKMIEDVTTQDPNSTRPARSVTGLWQATSAINYLLAPDSAEDREISLAEVPAGTYTATYRLLFRTFPMYFLREVELRGNLDPTVKDRVPIAVLYEDTYNFSF